MTRLTENFKQTEEYEEVLGADAFPHRARGKAGRPLSTDKKIQMKLYSTADNKENLEYMARQLGLTSSQFVELAVCKLYGMGIDKRSEFLEREIVSQEEFDRQTDKLVNRQCQARWIRDLELNLFRKIQFSQGKFSPAEMIETFAYINHKKFDDQLLVRSLEFKRLLKAKGFREDEISKITNFIFRIIEKFSNDKKLYLTETFRCLWMIENFFCESVSELKINRKAEDIQVSEHNMLAELLLENN